MSNPIEKLKRKVHVPFTAERKEEYLDKFRNHPDFSGRKYLCAEAVGVSTTTVDDHLRRDPVFKEMFEDARQAWIDENLFTPAVKRARDGVKKPIVGGRNKDKIVTYERVYSDSLMLAMLRAHRSEFKDKDATAGGQRAGGVMVVPAAPTTAADWEAQYGEKAKGNYGVPKEDQR